MSKDYYHLLELSRGALLGDIKAAYRRLAAQVHPDKLASMGPEAQAAATARMIELNEAIAVLSDPVRRAEYDKTLRRNLVPRTAPASPRPGTPQREEAAVAPESQAIAEVLSPLRSKLADLPLNWSELSLADWEWAMEASNARRSVLVAYRHCECLSLQSARLFAASLESLLEEQKLAPLPTVVLSLVSCGRMLEPKAMVQWLRHFIAQPRGWRKKVEPLLVLYDGQVRRAVLFGVIPDDAEVESVLRVVLSFR
jgi:curved DNA-binding protein CbpA